MPGAGAGAGSDAGHQLQGAACKVQGGWRERCGGPFWRGLLGVGVSAALQAAADPSSVGP